MTPILLLEQSLNGLQFGLMLFLLAAGLTLVFGIMDMINLAHGSLYMVGAYLIATVALASNSFVVGLGVGIVAKMAFDSVVDKNLGMVDASHLFASSTTRIGLRRNAWLRGYVYAFIEGFAPHLSRRMVELAVEGGGTDAGL